MKWSVSNIEIDMTGQCRRNWMGWAPPSGGASDLHGDPANDLSLYISGSTFEGSRLTTFLGFADPCPGSVTIANITGLQAGMTAALNAANQDYADFSTDVDAFTQANMSLASNIVLDCQWAAGWRNYGTAFVPDWNFYTQALCYLRFRSSLAGDAVFYILVNDAVIGSVLTCPDPGLTWLRQDPDAFVGGYTYSHVPNDSGGLTPGPNFAQFFAGGTTAITGASYPLSIAQFFDFAGYFQGDWLPGEAAGLL